jgi:hypothetical protein
LVNKIRGEGNQTSLEINIDFWIGKHFSSPARELFFFIHCPNRPTGWSQNKNHRQAGHEGKNREEDIGRGIKTAGHHQIVAWSQLEPELSCWWHELFSVFRLPPLPNMGCTALKQRHPSCFCHMHQQTSSIASSWILFISFLSFILPKIISSLQRKRI